jgi:glycosyltransferase involved in cell wall biosynthesis
MPNANAVTPLIEPQIAKEACTLPFIELRPLPERPMVSVLITSYNYGCFLRQAIESVLQQSYFPIEIVVSDDGSEDDSCEIATDYINHGKPVKLFRGKHQGMAECLNNAFSKATGEILCFLDADDYFLPDKVEAVVDAFRSQPQAGFAVHRAQMVDHDCRPRGIYPLLTSLPRGNCAEAAFRNAGVLMGLPPTSNLSLRRSVAQRIFPLPWHFTGYAEQVIHRMAPLMTSICAIDKPLSVWRLHGRNDGNSARVAAKRLERELSYMDDLWNIQKSYLTLHNPELAACIPSLEQSAFYMKVQYMWRKLRNDPSTQDYHATLCAISKFRFSIVDLFWRYSLYFPRPIFQQCVDLLQTQSTLKEWLSRISSLRHAQSQ